MKNKLVALVIIGVFAMAGIAGIASAVKPETAGGPPDDAGPAEKATGDFWGVSTDGSSTVYLDMNAHEAHNNKPAKGEVYWYRDHPTYGDRDLYMNVNYVNVNNETNKAYIGAYCYDDTAGQLNGQWLYLIVYDGGTPGRNGDEIWARWYTQENQVAAAVSNELNSYYVAYTLVEGNLVVHT